MKFVTIACAALVIGTTAVASPALAADGERGRLIYETFCVSCHTPSVNKRAERTAKTYGQVRAEVQRWQANQGLKWTPEEIDDVTFHVNGAFYKYPAP